MHTRYVLHGVAFSIALDSNEPYPCAFHSPSFRQLKHRDQVRFLDPIRNKDNLSWSDGDSQARISVLHG